MKKFFAIIVLSCSLFTFCHGQYSVLLNFDGPNAPDGEEPEGSLTLSGGKLYGMTYYGGPHSIGNVFSVDTDGNNYKDLFDFNGTNGAYPKGDVTISGEKLYGMTMYGGINGIGNIFSMDTNGNNFKDLYDFSSGNSYPEGGGSLIISGSLLYGMTQATGTYSEGVIFSIDTNGNGYKEIFDFNTTNGESPQGNLTLFSNKFYGTTAYGGAHKCGVVFSMDTNGRNYKVLLNFDTANGAYPDGDLTILGNTLFGMTDGGGLYDSGCMFSIDTNGNAYNHLCDFNGPNGMYPGKSPLTLVGNVFCGTTLNGGLNDVGVIFSIDTNGGGFINLFTNFDTTNGEAPSGVINCGNTLYGMAKFGGANNEGVIFRYKQTGLGVNNLIANVGATSVYPNPNNGVFTIQSSAISSNSFLQVYNVAGEQIVNERLLGKVSQINLSNQPQGIYFYRVLNEKQELIGSGKLVIER